MGQERNLQSSSRYQIPHSPWLMDIDTGQVAQQKAPTFVEWEKEASPGDVPARVI